MFEYLAIADRVIKVRQIKRKNHPLACGTQRAHFSYLRSCPRKSDRSLAGAQVSDDANDRVTDSRGHYLPFNCLHVTRATESHFVSILAVVQCRMRARARTRVLQTSIIREGEPSRAPLSAFNLNLLQTRTLACVIFHLRYVAFMTRHDTWNPFARARARARVSGAIAAHVAVSSPLAII